MVWMAMTSHEIDDWESRVSSSVSFGPMKKSAWKNRINVRMEEDFSRRDNPLLVKGSRAKRKQIQRAWITRIKET